MTGKARAAIRRASRSQARRQYAGLGRHTLERRFEQAGKPFSIEALAGAAARLNFPGTGRLLAAVGRGQISPDAVLEEVHPDYRDGAGRAGARSREKGWMASVRSSLKFRLPRR